MTELRTHAGVLGLSVKTHQLVIVLCLLVATVYSSRSSAQQQTVYLAFDESAFQHVVVCAFGIPIPPTFDNTLINESSPFTPQQKEQALLTLTNIFSAAGVNNVTFTTTPPVNPAITVHYQGYRDCLKGVAVDGVDQFNETKSGERVFVFAQDSTAGFDFIEDRIRVTAHEVGHAFGLRHIAFPAAIDPKKESIMDNRLTGTCKTPGCVDRFINFPWWVDNLVISERSNPVYHLRRWVDGESDASLQQAGVCPGIEWDLPLTERVKWLLRLVISPGSGASSGMETPQALPAILYDVKLLREDGNDVPTLLEQIDEAAITEPLVFEHVFEQGQKYLLVASSADDQPPDMVLTFPGSSAAEVDFISTELGERSLVLSQLVEDTLQPVADAVATTITVAVFDDGFEATPGKLESTQEMEGGSPCFPLLTVQKTDVESGLATTGGFVGSLFENELSPINCGPDCVANLPIGSSVILYTFPGAGFVFKQWAHDSDVCKGETSPNCEFILDGNKTARAVFEEDGLTLTGAWFVTENVDGTDCGDGVYTTSYPATVTQTGNAVTFCAGPVCLEGSISGNSLHLSGSYPDDGGITSANVNATVAEDFNSLSGSSDWSWSNGQFSCSGTTQVSASRL